MRRSVRRIAATRWGGALDYASGVAVKFLDLVADSVFEALSLCAASDSDSRLRT
jgi:hypothetical protein